MHLIYYTLSRSDDQFMGLIVVDFYFEPQAHKQYFIYFVNVQYHSVTLVLTLTLPESFI